MHVPPLSAQVDRLWQILSAGGVKNIPFTSTHSKLGCRVFEYS